ncbi:MAG: hypothetical protein LBV19_01940 [Streptococcaceae bacterium]|jgi:pyruvate,water dikinase|nr:hypothetical protein [Streptococcaceae bacterium]
MLITLSDNNDASTVGAKAASLLRLSQLGFPVPAAFILPEEVFTQTLRVNALKEKIDELLARLCQNNISEVSREFESLWQNARIPGELMRELGLALDAKKGFAVRSSGLMEDLPGHSFAGQYVTRLNVSDLSEIEAAILDCYRSMYSETNLAYMLSQGLELSQLGMAVILQEMVHSEVSGVAFTVNPVTGADKEIVIELVEGQGERLVSGQAVPERFVYNWFDESFAGASDGLLDVETLTHLAQTFLKIQMSFGFPVDIEFALKEDRLSILQARPITKIGYSALKDQWTNANFKDGGVSSTVCTPFMWTLYEAVWPATFFAYMSKALFLKPEQLAGPLAGYYFGRPYWNLSKAKLGMANVIGYKERVFDEELGVTVNYEGQGTKTTVSPRTLLSGARILKESQKNVRMRLSENASYQKKLLKCYDAFMAQADDEKWIDKPQLLENFWQELIFEHYIESESVYFNQIYINTVAIAIFKNKLKKYLSESEIFLLMSSLDDVSHLRPYLELWQLSRKIRQNAESLCYWRTSSNEEISQALASSSMLHQLPELRAHIQRFAYHSDRELDIAYPNFAEAPDSVIVALKSCLELEDQDGPDSEIKKQKESYQKTLATLIGRAGQRRSGLLQKDLQEIRRLLWWREEFKDISSRYYNLIRIYSLKLAQSLVNRGVFQEITDIWYLKTKEIQDFLQGESSQEQLQAILLKNKSYVHSFQNFQPDNEIGNIAKSPELSPTTANTDLKGVGANPGTAVGRARLILEVKDLHQIKNGDILVTRYTDTGWTSKFPVLKGLVTEHGGTLCHASIVAREYGLPCIVSCAGATQRIKDGDLISIDGASGIIKIGQ